jgi:putative ABC transport system permease protein
MGTGQVVFGLATVIIGVALFRRLSFVKGTTAVVVGSILYKLCIAVALDLGLPPNMMKLITAVLFLLVLVASGRKGEEIIHA